VRDDFFTFCRSEIPKTELKMKLAAKGFAETKEHFVNNDGTRTTRRVYRVSQPDFSGFVKLNGPARAG
jgi:hypothetical protein